MNRVSLAFIRVFFFVMLFVSTACNKMDSSLLRDDFSAAQSEVSAANAAAKPDAERVRELEGRVAQLEGQLAAAHQAEAFSDIPGGANWD